jgi:hypothetical protein
VAASAVGYRVYRSTAPDGALVLAGPPATTLFEDIGALSGGLDLYYRVFAVDTCGNESAD